MFFVIVGIERGFVKGWYFGVYQKWKLLEINGPIVFVVVVFLDSASAFEGARNPVREDGSVVDRSEGRGGGWMTVTRGAFALATIFRMYRRRLIVRVPNPGAPFTSEDGDMGPRAVAAGWMALRRWLRRL